MILGIFLIKKDLIFHFRDNNKAPVNIKNKSTPHLKKFISKLYIHQFKDGPKSNCGIIDTQVKAET